MSHRDKNEKRVAVFHVTRNKICFNLLLIAILFWIS